MKSHTTIYRGMMLFAMFLAGSTYAQNNPAKKFGRQINQETVKCATTEYEAYLQQKFPNRATTQQFEQWIAPKVEAQKASNIFKNTNTVVTLPVVVHVIHNGDPIGTNENISDEQIMSQITVLNQDFRKMADTPGYNTNPVGADMEIEFCLAQRDPNGLATTGIIRYNLGNEQGWEMTDAEENLKPQTQWDPTQYINIWVVNDVYIAVAGQIIPLGGYSQFPVASGLDGLDESGAANTDGIVMGYLYFGSSDIYPEGNYDAATGKDKGDTLAHEMGHFFGLRHIWGDGDCDVDDYCEDTPVAGNLNQGCPTGIDSCPLFPGLDMIENYMDYTNDACQNVFTIDQKARMQAVLENSPRRASLITSLGCSPGITYDNDGSLNILNFNPYCGEEFAPSIMLTNAGNNTLTVAEISYALDGAEPAIYNWTGSLENGESVTIELPIAEPAIGEHTLDIFIISINDTEDDTPVNDAFSQTLTYNPSASYNTQQLVINILADDFGDETFWAVLDPEQNPVAFGGPLEDNLQITETVDIEISQCYTFAIIDYAADGICCDYGEGYYEVTTSNGTVVASGGEFTDMEMTTFNIDTTLGTQDFANTGGITLYPNPTNGIININMPDSNLPESYTIYNSLGQIVASAKVTSADSLSINTSAYSNGIYFIKLNKEGQSTTLKFIKN